MKVTDCAVRRRKAGPLLTGRDDVHEDARSEDQVSWNLSASIRAVGGGAEVHGEAVAYACAAVVAAEDEIAGAWEKNAKHGEEFEAGCEMGWGI